ncbi:uncharacterized protein FFE2_14318 [Fusarium fujikuroi]|uniref:Fungal N-terminal domain-containing protein n=1 Tax=Fusarium fujikuroi TaxID=5127 RepID=A0A9Q9UCK2_FUSFU|nr:uncharacterized protein FFE2_14318 [Fusarium fujikuroi]SCV60207.1 uncharacterized protein FFFS_14776 [Fusarium fujikuroi]VTT69519.1 unnamed protein product [Fusarium fujikuroi]
MAEAIGLVASVASLLDLALKLSNALHNLQFQFRNAPYLIQALENETEAVRTVLASVESSIHSTATAGLGGAGSPRILGDLTAEIGKGAAVLKELGTFIDSLKNETSTLRRVKWIQKKEKAAELIKELKEVRYRISELQLAYGNSSLNRIGLVLQDIQVMQRRHYAKTHNLETCLLDTKDQLTIDRDTTFQNQSDIAAALEALQNTTPKLPQEWVETISNQLTGNADIMAQIHSEDRFGMTPLMYAVALGDSKAAKALIEAGASVHKKGPHGRSLVDYVACLQPSTCTALLDLLLTAGADATTVYPSGWTLLHTAALHDNATMMDRLVHEGARPDCFGPRGNRPIHYAARQNSVKAVRLLHGKGVDLNVIANSGLSPLGVAIQNNAIDTQTLLLELGADYLVTGDWGTYFHLAADYGCEGTLQTLSSFDLKGWDVDATDAQGLTATDVFENRYDKTDEITKAFYHLKDSIQSKSSVGMQDQNKVGDMDEFFDVHEFLHYGDLR